MRRGKIASRKSKSEGFRKVRKGIGEENLSKDPGVLDPVDKGVRNFFSNSLHFRVQKGSASRFQKAQRQTSLKNAASYSFPALQQTI